MFPEDPKDPELSEEAEELLTHWPLDDKSPAEWEDLALRIDARIKITEVGSTPDYLLEAPLLEEQDLLRRSHPRMKRPSEGSLAALAKASLVKDSSPDAVQLEAEREALARSLLSLAVKARTEPQSTAAPYSTKEHSTKERSDSSASLSELVNGGPAMQFLATRQTTAAVHGELPRVAESDAEAPTPSAVAASSPKGSRERGSMWFGIAFGLLGMAAAGVMYVASPEQPALDDGATLAAQPVAAPAKAELPEPAPKPAAPAPAAGDLLKLEEVPLAEAPPARLAALPDDTVLPKDRAAAVRPGAGAPAAAAAAAAAPGAEQPALVAPPAGPSEPGMVMADSRGTLPDHPSTGAVQAAVGMVMGAARACVAGQSDASRATLNFGSDGRVQSVTIAGPAQATSAEPCLRNALSGARVQPFARAGYSVTLTVRPQ